jgi:hypothetical protein
MQRTIAAIPTMYNGVQFRSRLEARWAAFFDLQGWYWEYEPVELEGWIPDFWLSFPCRHSECYGSHELFIEIKPFAVPQKWDDHGKWAGHLVTKLEAYDPPHPAMFGISPEHTRWEMSHGAGGGMEDILRWAEGDWASDWREAGNRSQWKGPTTNWVIPAKSGEVRKFAP